MIFTCISTLFVLPIVVTLHCPKREEKGKEGRNSSSRKGKSEVKDVQNKRKRKADHNHKHNSHQDQDKDDNSSRNHSKT